MSSTIRTFLGRPQPEQSDSTADSPFRSAATKSFSASWSFSASRSPRLTTTCSPPWRRIGNQIGDFLSRKHIEVAVSEEQTRTRAILETALDAIISMDQHGRITEFNRAAERMFGYSRDQAIGQELATLIIPESCAMGTARV